MTDLMHPRPNVRRLLPAAIGAGVRAARERLGLPLDQAAQLAAVSHSHLSAIERGRACPSLAVARELVNVLYPDPDVADLLLAAAVPDRGRSYPGKRDRGAATRRSRYFMAAVLAYAAGVTEDAPACPVLGSQMRPLLPSGQPTTAERAAPVGRDDGSARALAAAPGCDLSLDRQDVGG